VDAATCTSTTCRKLLPPFVRALDNFLTFWHHWKRELFTVLHLRDLFFYKVSQFSVPATIYCDSVTPMPAIIIIIMITFEYHTLVVTRIAVSSLERCFKIWQSRIELRLQMQPHNSLLMRFIKTDDIVCTMVGDTYHDMKYWCTLLKQNCSKALFAQVLTVPDKELNSWVSVKKMSQYRCVRVNIYTDVVVSVFCSYHADLSCICFSHLVWYTPSVVQILNCAVFCSLYIQGYKCSQLVACYCCCCNSESYKIK